MIEKKVSRFLIVVCVAFLFASFMFSSLLLPVRAAADVTIVNHSGYMDFFNYYHVVGEVQNTGDVPVQNVHVSVIFYDVYDQVVESDDSEILLVVLLVGRKAPFLFTVDTTENSALVHSYAVSISSWDSSSGIPLGLEILSHTSYVAGPYPVRIMAVTGQIRNNGALTANAVRVVATFFSGPSGTGTVVGVSLIPSIPMFLSSGQEGSFTIAQDVSGREHLFVSYVLTAESVEYALVPEFSASIISVMLMITTLVAVAIVRKKQL